MKTFIKTFFAGLLIFTILLVPIEWGLSYAGSTRLFGGTESLVEDMPQLAEHDSPFYDAFQDAKRVNILLIGVNDGMTDTLMLGSYDLEADRVDVISIPRDTYFEREDAKTAAEKKINSIYGHAKAVGTAEAVSKVLMGMPINYYVVVDYDVVSKVVDSMGGVPMNISFHMHYNDPYDKPPLKIDIPEGYQTLNGEKAIQFLRFRKGSDGYSGYPEGDIGRIKAQQEFIKSAFRQALGFSLPKVVKTALENVDSDLPVGVAAKLAAGAVGLEGGDMQTHMIPGKSGTKYGLSFWLSDEQGIEDLLKEIYGIETEAADTEQSGNDGETAEDESL